MSESDVPVPEPHRSWAAQILNRPVGEVAWAALTAAYTPAAFEGLPGPDDAASGKGETKRRTTRMKY